MFSRNSISFSWPLEKTCVGVTRCSVQPVLGLQSVDPWWRAGMNPMFVWADDLWLSWFVIHEGSEIGLSRASWEWDSCILGPCGFWWFDNQHLIALLEERAFLLIVKLEKWAWLLVVFFFRPSLGTVFDDAFWLELNYLEVAKVAQSCAAHFTALLYAEIYADKKSMEDQDKR